MLLKNLVNDSLCPKVKDSFFNTVFLEILDLKYQFKSIIEKQETTKKFLPINSADICLDPKISYDFKKNENYKKYAEIEVTNHCKKEIVSVRLKFEDENHYSQAKFLVIKSNVKPNTNSTIKINLDKIRGNNDEEFEPKIELVEFCRKGEESQKTLKYRIETIQKH